MWIENDHVQFMVISLCKTKSNLMVGIFNEAVVWGESEVSRIVAL